MNDQDFQSWLEQRCGDLPREMAPKQDLWPRINARIDEQRGDVERVDRRDSNAWPFAAGMAAAALIALLSVQFTRDGAAPTADSAQSDEADLFVELVWQPEITRTRNELGRDYNASLETLAPQTRAVVEQNLTQIHSSLAAIHLALAEDPTNQSLHRLLAGTYQQELNLLSNIGSLGKVEAEL